MMPRPAADDRCCSFGLRRDEEETLPTLVAELTDSSWCAAVESAARLMPSADNDNKVRKVQELSLQTVRGTCASLAFERLLLALIATLAWQHSWRTEGADLRRWICTP
jgi:hypothetical protein